MPRDGKKRRGHGVPDTPTRRPGSIIWPWVRIWKDILATMDCPGGRKDPRFCRFLQSYGSNFANLWVK